MHRRFNVVGRMVAKFRFERNWTQEKLSEKLQLLGLYITRQTIAHIEHGRCAATDTQIVFIAKAYNINVQELFPVEFRQNPKTDQLEKGCASRQPRNSPSWSKARRARK